MALRRTCADHPRYVGGCEGCRSAAKRYYRAESRAKAYGTWNPWGDIDAARRHVRLLSRKATMRAIARAAGMHESRLREIMKGRVKNIHKATAEKLLGVTMDDIREREVSSLGTSRRLLALGANDWGAATLGGMLGKDMQVVKAWRQRRNATISQASHHAVAELYRKIGDARGPDKATGTVLRKQGHLPPAYWDDDGDLDRSQSRPKTRGMRIGLPARKEKAS